MLRSQLLLFVYVYICECRRGRNNHCTQRKKKRKKNANQTIKVNVNCFQLFLLSVIFGRRTCEAWFSFPCLPAVLLQNMVLGKTQWANQKQQIRTLFKTNKKHFSQESTIPVNMTEKLIHVNLLSNLRNKYVKIQSIIRGLKLWKLHRLAKRFCLYIYIETNKKQKIVYQGLI